jgi:Holliday junction resolvase RusA-like endonuclease
VDNFIKGLFDAVFEEDSHIWDCRMTKIWGTKGAIEIRELA